MTALRRRSELRMKAAIASVGRRARPAPRLDRAKTRTSSMRIPSRPCGIKSVSDIVPVLWRRVVVLAVPLGALMVMVVPRYSRSWYFYDEWSLINRVVTVPNAITAAFEPYNGHLYTAAYITYKAASLVGLDGHAVVWSVFCLSLLGMNAGVALVLWRAGVRPLLAVIAGAVVTYYGPGAQLATFEILFTWNGAIALPLIAAYLVIRKDADESVGIALWVGSLLLVAIGFDSASSYGGLLFVGVLAVWRWRFRLAAVALVPALVGSVTFQLLAGGVPASSPASVGQRISLFWHLLMLPIGGFVGGGVLAGIVVCCSALAVVGFVVAKEGFGHLPSFQVLVAGLAAAFALDGAVALTRAAVVGTDYLNFNRYVGLIGVYLMVATLPVILDGAWTILARYGALSCARGAVTVVLGMGLLTGFVLNMSTFDFYRSLIEGWEGQTHAEVTEVVRVVARGCPVGQKLNLAARPLGSLDPQLTVGLIDELVKMGSLWIPAHSESSVKSSTIPPPAMQQGMMHSVCSS